MPSERWIEQLLLAAGVAGPDIVAIDSLSAQKRMVEAGFGIALMVESAVQEELLVGSLRVLDVPALRARMPVCVVHRRSGYLGEAARALLSTLAAPGAMCPPTRPRN
jgi:DNA-binding transcriptional LysR family regulator